MLNSQKRELRADVRELAKKGLSQREAVKELVEDGYGYSTALNYWKIFSVKKENSK